MMLMQADLTPRKLQCPDPTGLRRVGDGLRGGFTLVELSVALVVMTIAMALTVQLIGWVAAERRGASGRQWALREADNVLERVTSLPWDRLDDEHVKPLSNADRIATALPGGGLKIEIVQSTADKRAKRLTVEVRWKNRAGADDAPVRLSAWVFRAEERP